VVQELPSIVGLVRPGMLSLSQFGGLDLVDDPEEIGIKGAIDLLNVDIDRRGRIRSRDGYNNFLSSAASQRLNSLGVYYNVTGTKQLLASSVDAGANSFLAAYTTAGASIASTVTFNNLAQAQFTRFGGPAAEIVYVASWRVVGTSANSVRTWDGAAWAVAGGFPANTFALDVQALDNRLVAATIASNSSRIAFSDAGAPGTWTATSVLDLTPGDGERIVDIVSWRELVFVFKETKFFVFTGNSAGATGLPIFNYRPVAAGVGSIARGCSIATPTGVYFLSRRGIYRTTGGDPTLISRALDPIFRGGLSSFFSGSELNDAAVSVCQLWWHDERLYFAYPSGSSTTNDRLAVYDPQVDMWLLWNIATNGMTTFRASDGEELFFSYATGTNDIGRHSPSFTDDDGTSISSYYQTGWFEQDGRGRRLNEDTYLRGVTVRGSGSPTIALLTDYNTSDSLAAVVTLGTNPLLARALHNPSYKGKLFSTKISSTSPWSISGIKIGQYP